MPRPLIRTLSFLLLFLPAAIRPAGAQSNATIIPPPDPELERESFVLPEGFEAHLFAGDPTIAKPIQMNFDPQGRLWIASSSTYPQILPGDTANDRIVVLEDLDHDGVSDRTHVFAEGLLIPTAIEPGDGGAYVGASTELLHFRDTDGDLVADERQIVLSGFGTEDTHHIVHTLRWGPEQLLYFNQSIYIHSHIETPWGVRRLNAGGIWQFRPESLRLEVLAKGLVNPWGLAFDDYGVTFATDGAGGEGINYIVPGAYYTTAFGAPRILAGLNPGSPKHCGLEIVGGPALPDDWQGSFITNDFRGHRVCRFVLTEQGAGYVSHEQQELIRTDHGSFRPVDVKLGPDGAIYIADWYNPIIQHGEVDFRDPRRDHTHGRIWRITYTGRPAAKVPDLAALGTPALLDQLRSDHPWVRQQAKRLLKERGEGVIPDLKQWARNLDNTQPNYHRHRLEALWMYQAFDVAEPELLASLIRCADHNARAAATRVIGHWFDRLPDGLALLERCVSDEHPRVRLEAVRVLAGISDPRAVEIATRVLDSDMDEWLDYALWLTCRELQNVWQPALVAGEIDFGGNARHLAFALQSAGSAAAAPRLTDLLAAGSVSDADAPTVLQVLTEYASPADLQRILELAAANDGQPARRLQYLEALESAAARRKVAPNGDLGALSGLLTSDSEAVRAAALRLAGLWHVESWRDEVTRTAQSEASPALVTAAIQALGQYQGDDAIAVLRRLAEQPATAAAATEALMAVRPRQAAASAITVLQNPNLTEQAVQGIIAAFLRRQNGEALFVEALGEKSLPPDAAKIGLRAVTRSGREFPALTAALTRAGGITTGPRELSPEEMDRLVAQVSSAGVPARGEQIFRRADLGCFKCHSIGNAGGQVGSNLISLGATAQIDYLIDSILQPNKQVKENYHTVVVATTDGKVFSGIQVRQTDTDLLLRDADDHEISIPLDQIEDRALGVSLMPAGLADKLTESELVDLVAFLSALGRLPEFTVSQTPIARRWQVMLPTDQAQFWLRRTSYATAATDDPSFTWQTVYSTVEGALPLADLPEVLVRNRVAEGNRGMSFARTEFEVPAATNAELRLNSADGLTAWLDDQPLTLSDVTPLILSAGRHRLTLAVDRAARKTPLKLELGGASEVQFASGR